MWLDKRNDIFLLKTGSVFKANARIKTFINLFKKYSESKINISLW
jgi:hypothetical protein